MPARQSSRAVGSLAGSDTFFPPRPVEDGRARGVAGLTLIGNGTSGASTTNNALTVNERVSFGTGLTVNVTTSAGVVTAVAINTAGSGYYEGDRLLYVGSGAATPVILEVNGVNSTGAVTILSFIGNGTSGAGNLTGATTYLINPRRGASGLTVNATATAGVITAVAVGNSAGAGYRIGDIVTINGAGASTPVTARVTSLTG